MKTPTYKGRSFGICLSRYLLTVAVLIVIGRTIAKLREDATSYRYAVVFDAGSTATRIHIYRFHARPTGVWKLEIVDEYFEEVKPGISSLNNSKEAELQTETLLENAFRHFPEARWDGRVPYVYRATAGMRAMLNKTMANELLAGVKGVIKRYANHQHASVSVLNGEDEGTYAWVTLAYLLPWTSGWPQMTTVDLGGASTQITTLGPHTRLQFSSLGPTEEVSLTSASLHDLGLVSVRRKLVQDNCSCLCMREDWTPVRFNHGDDCPDVYGHNGEENEHVCRKWIYSLIDETFEQVPREHHGRVYLFSYFFDAAFEANLVRSKRGGSLKVRDFSTEAKKWCLLKEVDKQFLCLDLIYAHSVLNYLLKLQDHREVEIVKKINGIEVSWTLGLVLSIL